MAAQRLWGEDIGEHQPAAGAGEGDLRFVPAVHAHQFLCLEEFEMIPELCHCHGFEMRRVPMAVCSQPDSSGLSVYLWSRLEGDPSLEGVYFVAAWAAVMFTEFYPVFCAVPAGGVLGMIIYVPPHNTGVFVEAVATLGQMGALPCHYIRRMMVDFPAQRVFLVSESWYVDAVNCLYYWQRGEWDRLMGIQEI